MFLGRTIALLCSSCYLIYFPQHLSLILAWQFFRLGAFEIHSEGVDVDNELFHYTIKEAYTPYNIHTYKTEEVVNQMNIKIKKYDIR